jgi:hypothetical protein
MVESVKAPLEPRTFTELREAFVGPKSPQARGESSTHPFLSHNAARWAQAA